MTLPDATTVTELPVLDSGVDSGAGEGTVAEVPVPVPVFRQMRLFAAENPMRERFPRAFMQTVPREPGVYYFRDADGKLLYVGQSHELRKRVGSYRHVHPDRNPKRLVRLVHQVRRIEWEVCATPEAAIERERELLLALRPGFNRAGVWKPPPWWLRVGIEKGEGGNRGTNPMETLRLVLCADAEVDASAGSAAAAPGMARPAVQGDVFAVGGEVRPEGEVLVGPFASSFRWVHAALLRCLHRWLFPEVPLHGLPAGLMGEKGPREVVWRLPEAVRGEDVVRQLRTCFAAKLAGVEGAGDGEIGAELLEAFAGMIPEGMPPMESEFWLGQVEVVARFAGVGPAKAETEGQKKE